MQKKQKLKFLFQIVVSLAIAVVLLFHLDLKEFSERFAAISWPVLGVIILSLIPALLARGYRWKLLFDNQTNIIKLTDSMALLFVGAALNLVLPASTGDIAKSYFGYKWSGVKERMLSVSLLDKVIALASVSILGIPCALYHGELLYAGLSTLVLLPAFLLLLLPILIKHAPFCRGLFEWATKVIRNKFDFSKAVEQVNPGAGKLAVALMLSVAGWLVTYLEMYLCFRAVGVRIPLFYVFSVAPLLTLVRLFPFTLSGVGSDEAAMWYFFSRAGAELEGILAGAFIFRLAILILPGIVGLFVLAGTKRIVSMEKKS
jgi:uncharacterized protein (TIRG00374 family)